jgi:hypothetical protein
MSRIRSVHPGFFTDENIVSVSMAARMLLIGLGIEADDKGTFEWKPLQLKMRLFPADNVDVPSLLAELEAADTIKKYEVDGRYYGAIRNFRKFQRPKTPNSVHPITPEIERYVFLFPQNGEMPAVEETPFPQKGEKSPQMEDGGDKMEDVEDISLRSNDILAPAKRASRIPDQFQPDQTCHDLVVSLGLRPEFQNLLSGFIDYWRGVPGAKGLKLDWQATFRNWIRNSQKFGNKNAAKSHNPNSIANSLSIVNDAIAEAERREAADSWQERGEDFEGVPRLRQMSA